MPGDPSRRPVVVVVGAGARDVMAADPRGWRLGGGAIYGAFVLARLGLRVRALIGLDGEARGAWELNDLGALGVEIQPVDLRIGPIFVNSEGPRGRSQRVLSVPSTMGTRSLPREWRRPDGVLLTPILSETGGDWGDAFAPESLVAVSWQGYLRRVGPGGLVRPHTMLDAKIALRADIASVSTEDVGLEPFSLEQFLLRNGQHIVITRARRGSLLALRHADRVSMRLIPATRANGIDPTGAGDVFLATWLAAAVAMSPSYPSHPRLLHMAALAAGISTESSGPTTGPSLYALSQRALEQSLRQDRSG
jgi:sugar/nucleoside kinase (ribokinase family)